MSDTTTTTTTTTTTSDSNGEQAEVTLEELRCKSFAELIQLLQKCGGRKGGSGSSTQDVLKDLDLGKTTS